MTSDDLRIRGVTYLIDRHGYVVGEIEDPKITKRSNSMRVKIAYKVRLPEYEDDIREVIEMAREAILRSFVIPLNRE